MASKARYAAGSSEFKHPFVILNGRPLIVHVEAGLRSFDRTMPEEVNRIVTDALSDVLFTPSPDADQNLRREGIGKTRISYVGNIMIDALEFMRPKITAFSSSDILEFMAEDYGLITIHRPSNTDNTERLKNIVKILLDVSENINLVFPVHPRTKKQLEGSGLYQLLSSRRSIKLLEPQSYLSFMKLLFNCKFALTDSGGLQEETTYLRKPCLTLRPNTERPITIYEGTNELVDVTDVYDAVDKIISGRWKKGSIPGYWDGRSAGRIIEKLLNWESLSLLDQNNPLAHSSKANR